MTIDNHHVLADDVSSKFSLSDLQQMGDMEVLSESLEVIISHYSNSMNQPREFIMSSLLYDIMTKMSQENKLDRNEILHLCRFAADLIFED